MSCIFLTQADVNAEMEKIKGMPIKAIQVRGGKHSFPRFIHEISFTPHNLFHASNNSHHTHKGLMLGHYPRRS